jgi:hypothetical protein
MSFKGIVSKLTIKFWMSQKCGTMKYINKKNMTTNAVEYYKHTGYDNYKINLAISY